MLRSIYWWFSKYMVDGERVGAAMGGAGPD